MQLIDVLRDHRVEQPSPLELGEREVGSVRALVLERLEPPPVEVPEALRVSVEHVDVRDLHRVDVRPDARPGRAEVRDPRGHGDPGAGQRDGRLRLTDQLREAGGLFDREAHLPWNRGVRFPRNAEIPSRASSDANAVTNACFSASIPASRSPAPETFLICSIATGA